MVIHYDKYAKLLMRKRRKETNGKVREKLFRKIEKLFLWDRELDLINGR